MPIIAKGVTSSLFEIGIIVASFSFAQILSEMYFGRISDKKGKRLLFIRIGFIGCAITFGLHYFAEDATLLLLARLGAGITSGIMIPAMLAYVYEAGQDKTKVASVVSFHALGWLAGIVAAGIVNDVKIIFLVSSCFFLIGLILSLRLPNIIAAAQNMGAKGSQLITSVMIPAAFPYLISGFKQGWAFAWRGVIGAELLFSFLGLGFLLNAGRQLNDVSEVIAMMLVIMGIGILVDGFVFKRLENKVMARWGLR